jgi:hypothetical protein
MNGRDARYAADARLAAAHWEDLGADLARLSGLVLGRRLNPGKT